MLVSFVIPCYRSAKTIRGVVEDIQNIMSTRKEYETEIILVNDCSPDNTIEVIKALVEKYPNVIGVDIAKNRGQQNAILAGLRQSRGDLVVSCDDDGQTPIEVIFEMIDKLENEHYDIVCANYGERGKRSPFRRLGTFANRQMVKLFLEKPDEFDVSVFFVARRFIIEEMSKYENPYPYISGLILRATHNIGNVDVMQKDRAAGQSGYNIKKLLGLWVNGLTTFSIKPLRFATIMGSVLALLGFLIIIVLVIQKLINPDMSVGWTSIIATNILIGGFIMIILGVIGEYIGRIYLSINQSPQYVVRQVYYHDADAEEKEEA